MKDVLFGLYGLVKIKARCVSTFGKYKVTEEGLVFAKKGRMPKIFQDLKFAISDAM